MYVKAPSDMWSTHNVDLEMFLWEVYKTRFQLEVSIGTSVQLEGLTLENTSPDGTTHTIVRY